MKSKTVDKNIEQCKKKLGKKISKLRGEMSQRELARKIGLPNSNLKYIEDGVNAPTHEVYADIIKTLKPKPKDHEEMDNLFSLIRKTPPPDVCNIINENKGMAEVVRIIEGMALNDEQLEKVKILFMSFKREGKGEMKNEQSK